MATLIKFLLPVIVLCSCGASHKSQSSHQERTDSTHVFMDKVEKEITDEDRVFLQEHSYVAEENYDTSSTVVDIIIGDGGGQTWIGSDTSSSYITFNRTDSGLTVKLPRGTKSVKYKENKGSGVNSQADLSWVKNTLTGHSETVNSLRKDSTAVSKEKKDTTMNKGRCGLNLAGLILLIIVIAGVAIYFRYRSSRRILDESQSIIKHKNPEV